MSTAKHASDRQKGSDAPPQGGGAAVGVGLVPYKTTGTPGYVLIDRHKARMARMSHAVKTSARLHCESLGDDVQKYQCIMWTLTYAPGNEWSPEHISRLIRLARQHFHRRGIVLRFCWVAELQLKRMARTGCSSRQALHYHVLLWLPIGASCPQPDTAGWWPHGMTNTVKVRAPISYATKYASKGSTESEQFPKGARCSAAGGFCPGCRRERRWWLAPRWVREGCAISDDPIKRRGGGFLLRGTGEVLQSPWCVIGFGASGVRVCLKEYADAVNADIQRRIEEFCNAEI